MAIQVYSEENIRQLNAIRLKYLHNCKGFLTKFRIPIYFLIITAALDCMTTSHFMLLCGVQMEAHPLVRYISMLFGPIWGPITGKFCQCVPGLFAIVFVRKYAGIIIWSAATLYLFAAWYNIFLTTNVFNTLFH